MINCFLHDQTFHRRAVGLFNESELNSGFGYATNYIQSFFNEPMTITDIRGSRQTLDTFLSTYKMYLTFDATFNTGLDPAATDDAFKDKLFNIIEIATFYTHLNSTDLDATLSASAGLFGGYQAGSLELSAGKTEVDVYANDTDAAVQKTVHHWIMFDFEDNSNTITTIKVWLKGADFTAEYPHTYFTEVIYPGDPAELLIGGYSTGTDALSSAVKYAFDRIHTPVAGVDNTGFEVFSSAYNPPGVFGGKDIPFATLYKGHVPSTHEIRDYIRTDLLARNLATEDEWKSVFPDLFIDGKFFLVPVWEHVYALPEVDLPMGIIPTGIIPTLVKDVFPGFDTTHIDDHLEVLVSSGSEFFIASISNTTNSEDAIKLSLVHPTYQAVDATRVFFQHQATETKEFNEQLAACIATLTGANNTSTFSQDEISGRNWLTFVVDHKEYHVLKQESYPRAL